MVDEVTNDWIEHYKNPKNRHGIAWELALAGFLPHGVDPNNPGVIEILNSDKQKMSDIDIVLQALKRSYLFQVNCELTEVESKMLLDLIDGLRFAVNEQPELEARIAELEAENAELRPYRDGYDFGKVKPPVGEIVLVQDCDRNFFSARKPHADCSFYESWNAEKYEWQYVDGDEDWMRWYPVPPEVIE